MKGSHGCLCQTIAEELENNGFATTVEKWLETSEMEPRNVIVDVFARKNDETLIIECGYCPQQKLKMLRKLANRVIHIPYITQWCPYDPFPSRRKAYEESVKIAKYDFRDYLKR